MDFRDKKYYQIKDHVYIYNMYTYIHALTVVTDTIVYDRKLKVCDKLRHRCDLSRDGSLNYQLHEMVTCIYLLCHIGYFRYRIFFFYL